MLDLQGRETATLPNTPTIPGDRERAPISLGQRQMLYYSVDPETASIYNSAATIRFRGPLDVAALERSLTEVTRRHEAWRTTYTGVLGEVEQVIHPVWPVNLPVVDLTARPAAEREAEAGAMVVADLEVPFDLVRGPLWRARLVRLAPDDWRLQITFHHSVYDLGSLIQIATPELAALYAAETSGRPWPRLPEPEPFRHVAQAERDLLGGERWQGQLAFWREKLQGAPPTELWSDHPRPPRPTYRGATLPVQLSPALTSRLRELAHEEGATLFQAALAAFLANLGSWVGHSDLSVGTVTSRRRLPGFDRMFGYLANTIVIRSEVGGSPTFRQLIRRGRADTLEALRNSEVPFPAVVQALNRERDPSRNPLFQIFFLLEPPQKDSPPGWEVRHLDSNPDRALVDLTVYLTEHQGGLEGCVFYATDLFERPTVERFRDAWLRLLRRLVEEPDRPVDTFPLVSDQELATAGRNPVHVPYPASAVHELVSGHALSEPGRTAVVAGTEELTYGELDRRANQLANHLLANGVSPGRLVGVCLPRRVGLPIALLGVLKAGCAYVPLDPAYPPDRLAYMAEDAGLATVLTTREIQDGDGWPGLAAIGLDEESDAIAAASPLAPPITVTPEDRAYVLYTSGSTGRPKGVEISHRSLVNLLWSARRRPGFGPEDVLLAVSSISFDPHALQLFLPLVCGARLVIADRETVLDGEALGNLLERSGVTVMSATPSVWELLVRSGWQGDQKLRCCCGGEALSRILAEALLARCGEVWNVYGPTETTIWSTVSRVRPGQPPDLGEPVANTRLLIVDQEGRVLPQGPAGELLIGGDGLALGYLHRPELTAERFAPDPLGSGERVYRTGDLVRRDSGGRLRFLGRIDDQVKVRGHRIEVGEVEHALVSQPGISRCVVVARGDGDLRRLIAYLEGPAGSSTSGLRRALAETLPDYMLPQTVIHLGRLPTLPNGKIDRAALPEPAREPEPPAEVDSAPRGRLETELTELWSRLLGTGRIGLEDSFFDLGGHSLLAVRMLGEVAASTGVRAPIGRFLTDPTILGLAAAVRDGVAELDELVVVDAGDPQGSPLFLLYPDVITLPSMRHLAPLLPGHRLWGIAQGGRTREFDRSQTVEDLARDLVPLILERQPEGPIRLIGHSFGGLLAYEVARQLESARRPAELVALFDTAAPALFRRNMRHKRRQQRRERWQRLRSGEARAIVGRMLRRLPGSDGGKRPPVHLTEDGFDYAGAIAIQTRYRPRGTSTPLFLLTATHSTHQHHPALLGWPRVHRGPLLQRWVPGDHWTMLLEPHVAATAGALREAIAWGERHDG